MQQSISAHFSADAAMVQAFCHSARHNYEHFHVIVYLLEEIMTHFHERHITYAGMLELASSLLQDSPALELEFMQLAAEQNIIYKTTEKKSDPVDDEPVAKKPRILTLGTNLESDNCDPGSRNITTSIDMCYALLCQETMSHTVEHFLEKAKRTLGAEFRNFAKLIAGAKYAFSKHMYMDLITYVGRIYRILPGQFHHEFKVFFPICEAYQVYPHLRFKGMAKQRALLHTGQASSPGAVCKGVREELLIQQKTSNSKLSERLLVLRSMVPPGQMTTAAGGGSSSSSGQRAAGQVPQQTHGMLSRVLQMQQQMPPTQQQMSRLQHLQTQQQLLWQRQIVYQQMQQQLRQLQAQQLHLHSQAEKNPQTEAEKQQFQAQHRASLKQQEQLVKQMAWHIQQQQQLTSPLAPQPQLQHQPVQNMHQLQQAQQQQQPAEQAPPAPQK
jgi:hypothetical protein